MRWPRWLFPFMLFSPETASSFGSFEELFQVLRASCHIPLLGGILPYNVFKADGTLRGAFIDGLFWPSILYSWRTFDASDAIVKVSGIGWPTAHVRLRLPVPPHWVVLPPSQRTLWRLYAAGYDDTAHFFSRRRSERGTAHRRLPGVPSPSRLPPPPRQSDLALTCLVLLGWAHLLVLTLLFPLVPPYLVVRSLLRPVSAAEHARGDGKDEEPTGAGNLFMWFRRGLLVCVLLAIWPFILVGVILRLFWPFDTSTPLPGNAEAPTARNTSLPFPSPTVAAESPDAHERPTSHYLRPRARRPPTAEEELDVPHVR
jgi:hypothetical protein